MEITIVSTDMAGVPTVACLRHGTEEFTMDIGIFEKTKYSEGTDIGQLFHYLNGYWKYLEQAKQLRIFNIYKEIKFSFENTWELVELTKELYAHSKNLMAEHDVAAIKTWVGIYSDIHWPVDLVESFIPSSDHPITKEKTYLKEEYKWLVSMTIALRAMIPIWGEYISKTKGSIGTTYKEMYAYRLLSTSAIYHSEPMERLRTYVEHTIPNDKSKTSAILGGIGTEDFPNWVLGLVVIRKLSVCNLSGVGEDSSLVALIWKFISHKVKSLDNSFIGTIKEKITIDSGGTDSEKKLSKLEGHKAKAELADGDISMLNAYAEDSYRMARHVCPDIDLELVKKSLETCTIFETVPIWESQILITRMVLKKVLPTKAIFYQQKSLTASTIAVAQALLWHRKHYELAALVSAVGVDVDDTYSFSSDSRARVTPEQIEMLDKLYPYAKKPSGKKKVISKKNTALEAIDNLSTILSEGRWKLTLPQEWLDKVVGNTTVRNYSVPHNLKILLADLIISIAKREF